MIHIAKPIISDEEKQAVLEVLESGRLAQGEKVAEFENAFAKYIGVKHAIAVSSGTTALHTALLANNIGPSDEVITSPFTFIATANSILFTGARPVFADIDSKTFNLDPAEVEKKITPKTKALLLVHLYGQPCDMDSFKSLARKYELIIIEDACQAHGAEFKGKKVGSFGTGCFSFYPTKNMTTGEGGMITTNDDQITERVQMIRAHGSKERYKYEILGYNFRMTNIQAAIGIIQLKNLNVWNDIRIKNAQYLTEKLKDVVMTPFISEEVKHVYHQYTIRPKIDRDIFREKLQESGIDSAIHYPITVHNQPLYKNLGYNEILPISENACKEVVSLPVHPGLTNKELKKIVAAIIRISNE